MENHETITAINKLQYFSHDVIWCKAERIGGNKSYDENETNQNALFVANPFDAKIQKQFVAFFMEVPLAQNLPEYFDIDYWLEVDWIKSDKQNCGLLMDVMIAKSKITHQEHADYHNDMAKNVKGHGNNYQFDVDGNVTFDFVDYQKLKAQFLEQLFDDKQVTFLTNYTSEAIQNEKANYPAVIGIDADTIGFFWFME